MSLRLPGLLLPLVMAACNSTPMPAEVPALIVNADADSRRELRQVVSAAVHQSDVQLADDALTASSTLSLEPTAPRGLNAPPAGGRNLGRPELFRLLQDGPQCLLEHQRTGLRWLLVDTECVAE